MIEHVQIDTNAYCGSKCWFCPVKYYQRPHHEIMSNELFENILTQFKNGISEGYVIPNYTIWLSSYNDVLQDRFLKNRLNLLRNYGKQFQLLTNGIGLLKNIDILSEFEDVIHGYSVNLCAGNKEDYSKFTGNGEEVFGQIIEGLVSLYSKNPDRYRQIVTISVNGAYDDPIGRIQLKYNLPEGDTDKQIGQLRKLLPYKISDARPLCDRAGLLRKVNIIDNQAGNVRSMWKLPVGVETATGCNGGNRLDKWIHVGSNGNLYLCCQDFFEKYSYGNAKNGKIFLDFYGNECYDLKYKMLKDVCRSCWFSF